MTTVGSLEDLRAHRGQILDVARRRRVHRVRVFGSVARGEARSDSDVDFLVDFDAEASLLDQVGLIRDLEDLLGTRVDVVSVGGLLERDTAIRDEAVDL